MNGIDWNSDTPWNRLPWTLPAALLIWAMALWALAFFLVKPVHRPPDAHPIEARFIEQFIPAAPEELGPGRAPDSQEAESAEQKPEAKSETNIKERPKPIAKPQHHPHLVTKPNLNPAATAVAPSPADEGQGGTVGEPLGNIGARGGSPYGKGESTGSLYPNSGARAILQPLPQIPDEMRRQVLNSSVLARFHVAADGSAEVELAQPTQDVRLNRIVMDSLKKWRFMPAIRDGKPVASIEDILVKIQVR